MSRLFVFAAKISPQRGKLTTEQNSVAFNTSTACELFTALCSRSVTTAYRGVGVKGEAPDQGLGALGSQMMRIMLIEFTESALP